MENGVVREILYLAGWFWLVKLDLVLGFDTVVSVPFIDLEIIIIILMNACSLSTRIKNLGDNFLVCLFSHEVSH